MGNSASRKAGTVSAGNSPSPAPKTSRDHRSFPGSPVGLPVRIPTGHPAGPAVPVSATVPAGGRPQSYVPSMGGPSATVPIPVAPTVVGAPMQVPIPIGARRPVEGPARTMPIGVPGRGPAPARPASHWAPQPTPVTAAGSMAMPGYGPPSQHHHHSTAVPVPASNTIAAGTRIDSDDLLASYRNEYRPPRLPLPIDDDPAGPRAGLTGIDVGTGADAAAPGTTPEQFDPTSPAAIETSSDEEDESADRARAVGLVPTLIEWRFGGSRVYVTGTFANWNRKYRLHKHGASKRPNTLSTILNLKPGTHHLKFIVDNDLRLSADIPTTVDFTNVLVNYVDVVGPSDGGPETGVVAAIDAPPLDSTDLEPSQTATSTEGIDALSEAFSRADGRGGRAHHRLDAGDRIPLPPSLADSVSEPLNILPPGTVVRPEPPAHASLPTGLRLPSTAKYHSRIPRFLLDMEEESDTIRAARSIEVINRLYVPPTLPMFLGKSILNTATPLKDDASVLVVPNHTVLNHLATSSIKQNVLATSATTRYRRKFLTTIMHKPVGENSA